MRLQQRRGFTIIELLIVVIVIGILAAAGLAKYQNFAETSRRKTCLAQLQQIENGLAVWETTNTAFAENAKAAWGYTPRTGRLTSTWNSVTGVGTFGAGNAGNQNILNADATGTIPACADTQTAVVGAPVQFINSGSAPGSPNQGPLGMVIRDAKVFVCPSALSRYYGGEIQNVPDDYMDPQGGGVLPSHQAVAAGTVLGLGGRYFHAVAGSAKIGGAPLTNGGFPDGWLNGTAGLGYVSGTTTYGAPSPQVPFKIALCGCYGSFGPNSANGGQPGTATFQGGGPVGPDGSALNRHSARW